MFVQCPFHQDKPSPVEMHVDIESKHKQLYKCDVCGFTAEFAIGA